MKDIKWKLILTFVFLALAGYFLYPTFEWYRMPQTERDQLEKVRDKIMTKIINLGLDLRGGTHLVLELDPTKLEPNVNLADAVDRAIGIIRNRVDQFGVAEPFIAKQGDHWIVVQLPVLKIPHVQRN